jgi:hypothetical protein
MSEPLGDLDSLENALKALVPAGKLQRDEVMFRAGQATAARRGWGWPLATLGMTMLAACLAVRQEPVPNERVVVVHIKDPAPAVVAGTTERTVADSFVPLDTWTISTQHQPMEYQQLKQEALRWGVENLPLPMPLQWHESEPQTVESLLKELSGGKPGYRHVP